MHRIGSAGNNFLAVLGAPPRHIDIDIDIAKFRLCRCIAIQIKSEAFLEDLNNILNSGDVPNIYAQDELDNIYTQMRPVVQEANLIPTKTNLFSFYTKRVRSNLHTVITMR